MDAYHENRTIQVRISWSERSSRFDLFRSSSVDETLLESDELDLGFGAGKIFCFPIVMAEPASMRGDAGNYPADWCSGGRC